MNPGQVRAARVLLGWSVLRLALRSGTSVHLVKTFEGTGRVATLHVRTKRADPIAALRATLEEAGVEFTDGDAPGVKLREPEQ